MSILEVSNVSKSFGGVKANVDISMNVEKGRIVGLIGPNGLVKQPYLIRLLGLTQLIVVQLSLMIKKFLNYQCLLLQNLDC